MAKGFKRSRKMKNIYGFLNRGERERVGRWEEK